VTGSQRVLYFFAGRLGIIDRPQPEPGTGEVLLKPTSLGLCSSDFHIWEGRKWARDGIFGHEGAGTIAAVGSGVVGWNVGDFAVVNPLLPCDNCDACTAGRFHVCDSREIIGYNGRGLLGNIVSVPARALHKTDPGFPRAYGCLVEPLSCVLHSWDLLPCPRFQTVAIVGAGPMGVLHACVAALNGARNIWLIDSSEEKLRLVKSRFPQYNYALAQSARSEVTANAERSGAELTIIANSSRSGHQLAFDLVANGGCVLGYASINDERGPLILGKQKVDTDDLHRTEAKKILSATNGDCLFVGSIGFDQGSFKRAADMIMDGFELHNLISSHIMLDDAPALVGGPWQSQLKIVIAQESEDAARA
jgi:L-iditol 2-dehydrogenase